MRRERGVTLVELMVVVVIVALLAVVSSVSYSGYRRRTLAAEAMANLPLIATALESYKAEFGQYLNLSTTPCDTAYTPWDEISTCQKKIAFTDTARTTPQCVTNWNALGWKPENSFVVFRYRGAAGTGDPTTPCGAWASNVIPPSVRALGWYCLEAVADLRCDGGTKTTYRMVSGNTAVVSLNEFE